MTRSFEEYAATFVKELPDRQRVVVIGSTSFWHPDSHDTCISIGRKLAAIDNLLLITGGMAGVGETTGRSFHESRLTMGKSPDVFHLLPEGFDEWDYGETKFAGQKMHERREVLARVSGVYVAVEGGPGTAHEATVAISNGAIVIPIGRSGGHAGELYSTMMRPDFLPQRELDSLGRDEIRPDELGVSVKNLVISCLNARSV